MSTGDADTVQKRPASRATPSAKNLGGRRKAAAKTPKMVRPEDLPADYRPTDDEEFMGPMQKAYFRKKLEDWRGDIIRQTRETLEGLTVENAQHADLTDRASSETDRALELRARDRQRKLVSKIESAIKRLDSGDYGYCDETGDPISLRRLEARPIATLSIEAQERHERREKVYRDD